MHGTEHWAPDFLRLAGPEHHDADFACSTTLDGVTGSLCVTEGLLVLGGTQPTVRLRALDIRSWWDTSTGHPDTPTGSSVGRPCPSYSVVDRLRPMPLVSSCLDVPSS